MIVLADWQFKTKKELTSFMQNALRKSYGKVVYRGEKGFDFLMDLVNRHPRREEKINGEVEYFLIEKNFGGHPALSFKDINGVCSISWRKCVTGRDESWLNQLSMAFRQSIKDQIQEYKIANYGPNMSCPLCGSAIEDRKQAHVDHKTKSFKELFNEFTGNQKKLPKEFRSLGNHLCHTFKDEDQILDRAWKQFHKKHADFQIICAKCNVRKG